MLVGINRIKNKRYIFISLLIVVSIVLVYFFIFHPYLNQLLIKNQIPQLPDFSGHSSQLKEFVIQKYEAALNDPDSEKKLGELAMTFHANFFYDRAEICYQLALSLNPENWRWQYYRALIKEEIGDTESTIKFLKSLLKNYPSFPNAWYRLGLAYLKINSTENALKTFNQVLNLDEYIHSKNELTNKGAFPLKIYALFHIARTEFQRGNDTLAEDKLEFILKRQPTFGSAYRLLAQIYSNVGRNDETAYLIVIAGDYESYLPPADPLYDELTLYSRNTGFILKQFDIAKKSENYEWAIHLIQHILDYDPRDGEAVTKLLKLTLDMHMLEHIESLSNIYLELFQNNETKLVEMAKYMIYRSQYKAALKFVQKAIILNPKNVDTHIDYIKILKKYKKYTEAINHCNKVLILYPADADLMNIKSEILIDQGKIEEAKHQLISIRNLYPNDETSLILLARLSKIENKENLALRYYHQSLDINPYNMNTRIELGNFLMDLKKWNEASIHFENSLNLSPNDIDILDRYAWFLSTCPDKKLRNGKKALDIALRLKPRRKFSQEQDIKCGITLATAYGELKNYDQAINIIELFMEKAKEKNLDYYLPQIKMLKNNFQNGKSYHQ